MKDFPKRQLLINYLLGICTPGEVKEVEYWLDKEPGNSALLEEVAKEIGHEGILSFAEKREIKNRLFTEIDHIEGSVLDRKKSKVKEKRYSLPSPFARGGFWLKVAAMALVIITAGGVGLYYYSTLPSSQTGSEVKLEQRTLSSGQTATLRFGDGSVIKLNAGSTLRYPEKFSRNKREVYLEGEGFFSITHDESRPFIVHAGETTTRVLGTSFNVRAYNTEDEVQVAVAEGKVAVTRGDKEGKDGGDKETIYVTKNQWVTYRSSGQFIEKGEGDIKDLIAWKDKRLVFTDSPLVQIAYRLERWYNIEIMLTDSSLEQRRLSASFDKESITEVLTVIALSLDIGYSKEGRKVSFYKNESSTIEK